MASISKWAYIVCVIAAALIGSYLGVTVSIGRVNDIIRARRVLETFLGRTPPSHGIVSRHSSVTSTYGDEAKPEQQRGGRNSNRRRSQAQRRNQRGGAAPPRDVDGPSPSPTVSANSGAAISIHVDTKAKAPCSVNFVSYTPSAFESEWRAHAALYSAEPGRYTASVCSALSQDPWLTLTRHWLRESSRSQNARPGNRPRDPTFHALEEVAPSVFSFITQVDSCSGQRLISILEPLAGLLRDPSPVCASSKSANFNRGLELGNEPSLQQQQQQQRRWRVNSDVVPHTHMFVDPTLARNWAKSPGGRVLFFDVDSGGDGLSVLGDYERQNRVKSAGKTRLKWHLKRLKTRLNVPLSSVTVFAFEAAEAMVSRTTGAGVTNFYEGIEGITPNSTLFYNYAISAELDASSNPLTLLKRHAKPGDYIILKLHVHDADLELDLLHQILTERVAHDSGWPAGTPVSSLISELYWEPHFALADMQQYGWNVFSRHSLGSSLDMLARLRGAGIHAHAWD